MRPPISNADSASVPPVEHRSSEELALKLAAVESELRDVRRERDELESRLLRALEELNRARGVEASSPRIVVQPPVVAPQPAAPSIRSMPSGPAPELSRLVVSTRPAALIDEPPSSRSGGSERRRLERRECEFDVEFLGDSHFITGITQDLSEGGVFVATYQLLPVGTAVSIAFELPDGHRVEARGEVRWIRAEREEAATRPGLGIAFTELAPEALAKITAFCGSLPVRYYEF